LTVSLAGRVESYSVFGMAATPRLGFHWQPVDHFTVRGSWAKSVRAPNLGDLVERDNTSYIQPLGGVPALVWNGGNTDLQVERALTRTAGVEFKSGALAASLGYFDIVFRDRIQMGALPATLVGHPSVVTLNPSFAERSTVCARSAFFGGLPADCFTSSIGAIVDLRERNLATLWTDGLDFSVGGTFFHWNVGLKGTYILHYKQRDTPSDPAVSLLNTLNNPLALRVVGSLGWRRGPLRTDLDVLYSNGYRDSETVPTSHVGSWTTANLRVAYSLSGSLEAALQVDNLLNRYSPLARDNVASLGYDQENGDLTGRVLSLSLDYRW